MAEINKTEPNQFEQIGMNPFNSPTPGESLTVSPETRHAWESPPQQTNKNWYGNIKPVFHRLRLSASA